jgi:RecG-like helicase
MRQKFNLKSDYQPTGDQPTAISQLVDGLESGEKEQVLLGVTGSGKTFTMANIIANRNVPTLILLITKLWRRNFIVNSRHIFRKTKSTILSAISIITNRKPILLAATLILKKTAKSMTRLIDCVMPRLQRC